MAFNLGEFLVSTLLPVLKSVGKEKLVELLDNLHAKDEIAYKTTVTSLYGPVDVYLESIAEKSKTEIDDAFVEILMESLQASAGKHGIVLQNLDGD